jgi:hypothetical protein
MKENMESNIDKANIVTRKSQAVRVNSEKFSRLLSSKNMGTQRAGLHFPVNQISIAKPMSRNQYKSNNSNSFIQQKMDKINLNRALPRNTFIDENSMNPLIVSQPKESTNANELVEFIELEDLCRRDTETMDRSSKKLSFQTPQNKKQQNKKLSKYLQDVNSLKLKSNTKRGRVNDTSHLVKKMSITFCKDNKIIYD